MMGMRRGRRQSEPCGIMWRTHQEGEGGETTIDLRREEGVAMTEFALILPSSC